MIYTRDNVELGLKNHLICHVTGFYPAPVKIYWTKNEENVTEGTSINVPFPNKDGSFNQISRLEFIPQLGDIYSCTVKHLALNQPLTRIWGEKTLFNFTQTADKHLINCPNYTSVSRCGGEAAACSCFCVFCLQLWR